MDPIALKPAVASWIVLTVNVETPPAAEGATRANVGCGLLDRVDAKRHDCRGSDEAELC